MPRTHRNPSHHCNESRLDIVSQSVLPPLSRGPRLEVGRFAANLKISSLYKDLIWQTENFLTPSECRAWIAYGENKGFVESEVAATRDTAFRYQGRVQFQSADIASRLWDRIAPLAHVALAPKAAISCYSNIRLYRYTEGQRFGKHIDESVVTDNGQITCATVLIYLTGSLQGGETVFYDGRRTEKNVLSYKPSEGSMLLHGHGASCLTHEAQAVRRGTKYVLRTDICCDRD